MIDAALSHFDNLRGGIFGERIDHIGCAELFGKFALFRHRIGAAIGIGLAVK